MNVNLGARYLALGEIASGGMASVLLAVRRDDAGVHPVAVKQMHAHLVDDPQMVASFVDEARIASRIASPNVVHVHDVEMLGEQLVIVMEYVDGVSLADLLRRRRQEGRPLPAPVTRRILHDALLGLHAAHELRGDAGEPLGLVHRDVSPHNLLLGADGITRVSDFGIALATGRLASTRTDGAVKGKLQYLSPEQVYRKGVDRQADVFAAGIVLWECLAGRRLFTAVTEGETLAMVLREPIAPPSTVNAEVDLDLDEICLRALERDKERRYPTASALAEALAAGPMTTSEEIAQLVIAAGGEKLAARRALIADARAARSAAPPLFVAQATDALDLEETRRKAPAGASRTSVSAAPPSPERPRARGSLALVAMLAGSVLGGALVWLALRGATAAPPADVRSAATVTIPANVDDASPPAAASAASPSLAEASDAGAPAVLELPAAPAKGTSRSRGTGARATPRRTDAGAAAGKPFMPDDL